MMKRQTLLSIDMLDLPNFLESKMRSSLFVSTYAGIGSRKTPRDMLPLMTRIAKRLDSLGWTLRSGGADGADTAFEKGADEGRKQIFVPWSGFGRRTNVCRVSEKHAEWAAEIAAMHHPKWSELSDVARKLMARNTDQILGATLDAPSSFVVCWTPDGSIGKTSAKTGGTGQAIRIAHAYKIPVFNLKNDDHRRAWEAFAS